jgi:hypothetical protein
LQQKNGSIFINTHEYLIVPYGRKVRFAIEIRTNYQAIVSEKVIYDQGWARDAAMVIASKFKAWRKLVCAT